MSTIGSGYDLSCGTFSPEGRVFQVEYANKAVENGGTCIGLKVKNGIILATEKLIHTKLLVPGANKRIGNVDIHIGLAAAGLMADGRNIINNARAEAKRYRDTLDQPLPATVCVFRLGLLFQAYTRHPGARPFGASALVAISDMEGFHLYMIEPSGEYWGYNACAIGKGRQLARTEIEKLNFAEMDVLEGIKHAARIIHASRSELKDKQFELEMTWISPQTNGRHEQIPAALIAEAENYAKAVVADDMQG